jgi:hypothetical protein
MVHAKMAYTIVLFLPGGSDQVRILLHNRRSLNLDACFFSASTTRFLPSSPFHGLYYGLGTRMNPPYHDTDQESTPKPPVQPVRAYRKGQNQLLPLPSIPVAPPDASAYRIGGTSIPDPLPP